jgi:predicted transcriptional regulator
MISPPNAQQFAMVLTHTGLSDASLAKLFGVNQSTVSRLRHAKIQKVRRYSAALEASGYAITDHDQQFATRMAELTGLAKRTPALRDLLLNLHRIMHESVPE